MATRISKNGRSKIVDDKRLQRFLDEGWVAENAPAPEPKLSAVLEATADVIEDIPLEEEDEDEFDSSMPKENEGED